MGRLSPDLSEYVGARWMPFFAERVLRRNENLRPFLRDAPRRRRPFNYRKLIDVPPLAKIIAANDIDGALVSAWTRTIRRWISGDTTPTPNLIRRALGSLGVDWLIGIGRSGYYQHALVMLHVLSTRGNRSPVAVQAKAIFDRSDDQGDVLDDREALRATESELQRLDDAASACGWRDGGAVSIPTRCTLPRDFSASRELYAAWMLFDGAISGRRGPVEQRLLAARDGTAYQIEAWLASFYPVERGRALKRRGSTRRQP